MATAFSSLLECGRSSYKKATNAIAGQDFNSRAYEESLREPGKKVMQQDVKLDPNFYEDDEWTAITKTTKTRQDCDHEGEEVESQYFRIQETHLTELATKQICQTVNVTSEYVGFAVRFLALEAARDIGWVISTDAVRRLKERFPLLGDLNKAFEEGREADEGFGHKSDLWLRMREARQGRPGGMGTQKAKVVVVPEEVEVYGREGLDDWDDEEPEEQEKENEKEAGELALGAL